MDDLVLIGSRALALRAPGLLRRPTIDFDWLGTRQAVQDWIACNRNLITATKQYELDDKKLIIEGSPPLEFEYAENGNSSEKILELVREDPETLRTEFGMVPSLNILFLLKNSHKYKKNSPHFWKTAVDIFLMKNNGAKIQEEHYPLLKQREKETYTYKHPKLKNMRSNDFFDPEQGIDYILNHDSIHIAIARENNAPAYLRFQKDGSEVECDMKKFWTLPFDIQLNSVFEEASVLFIERHCVEFLGTQDVKKTWMFALSKILSSISSGKWRDFGYDNIFEVANMYDENLLHKFYQKWEDGIVKPFSNEKIEQFNQVKEKFKNYLNQ